MECVAQCCCHRTPRAAELPCAGNNTEAAAISCFSSDAYVSKHVLQPFSLPRELCLLFGEEFASASSSHSIASSAEVWSCFERLWISQVNYTLGITISMLSSMTFYFIGYLLVPVFLEMESRNREVNGRIKVCICYLLYSCPKHWVLGSMILLADVTQFEVLFQQCQKFWCCVSHLKADLSCSPVNIVGRLSQTCSLLCSPQGKKG